MSSIPFSPARTKAAESAAATSLTCSACDGLNRADRQFCGTCGARLWEPCLSCGEPNGATEKHCGSCGANLADELRRSEVFFANELADAEKLAAESLHAGAIDRLVALQIPDHGGLARYRQTAAERIASLRTEMLRCNRERDQALAAGRELLAAFDYEQAAIALESVAEPYRTDELRALLDLVRSRQVEMLSLVAEIRRAVAEKRTDGLLPKVEELLHLKPDHPQARALALRLRPLEHKRKVQDRDALYTVAKAHVDRHEYAEALKLLEQIPEDVRTRELARLIEEVGSKAAEIAWLSRDLREAVAYDQHLLPIAERLARLRPDNAEAGSFVERLRAGKRLWPEPPAASVWGPPLETISAFNRIDTSSLDSDQFRSSPDRFCVAAGLALQALDKALININLLPPEKPGLLGLLKPKKKTVTSAWGIDVGRAAIKVMRLSVTEGGERIVADAADYIEHGQILSAPEADWQTALCETLEKLCQRTDLSDAPLGISLPAHKVLFRQVALPLVDEKKLPELMKFEIRQQIPFPVEHVVWGYQMLAARTSAVAYRNECEVALLALKIDEVAAAIAPFTERELKVNLLTSDAAALLNYITFDHDSLSLVGRGQGEGQGVSPRASIQPEHGPAATNSELRTEPAGRGGNSSLVTAILDVGADSTNLIISNGASLIIRSIPLGGSSFSRTMVKEFQLTLAQAEKVKRNPTVVRELHRLYAALEPRFAGLAHELHRTIDSFLQVDPARRLSRFIVTGGGLKLHGALRRLWHGP